VRKNQETVVRRAFAARVTDGLPCGLRKGITMADASARFPKFVLHCRPAVHELRKVMGTGKSMIPVPLSI
jgi:hypothetical protein